jgi:hypothetical protein
MSRDDTENAGHKGTGAKPPTRAEKSTAFEHKQIVFTKSDQRNPPSLPGPQQ